MKIDLKTFLKVGGIFILSILLWLFVFNIFGENYSRETHILRAMLIFITAVPLVLGFQKFLDREPLKELNLIPTSKNLKEFLLGGLSWGIPALVVFIVLILIGSVEISTIKSTQEVVSAILLIPILVFIFEAFPEELIFRGYIFSQLQKITSVKNVIFIQAVLFTIWGFLNGGENSTDRTLLFFSFGLVMGALRGLTGNMWVSIGFHLAFQTVAQLLGSMGGIFAIKSLESLMIFAFSIAPFLSSIYIFKTLQNSKLFNKSN